MSNIIKGDKIMSKKYYQAPAYFQKLYEEGEQEKNNFLKYLSKIVGYEKFWVEKNIKRSFDMLDNQQKEVANRILDRAEIIKKYVWSRYYYENWDKVSHTTHNPFARTKYDVEKKRIIVIDPSDLEKKVRELGKKLGKMFELGKKNPF